MGWYLKKGLDEARMRWFLVSIYAFAWSIYFWTVGHHDTFALASLCWLFYSDLELKQGWARNVAAARQVAIDELLRRSEKSNAPL